MNFFYLRIVGTKTSRNMCCCIANDLYNIIEFVAIVTPVGYDAALIAWKEVEVNGGDLPMVEVLTTAISYGERIESLPVLRMEQSTQQKREWKNFHQSTK